MSINNLQQTSQGRLFDVCIYAFVCVDVCPCHICKVYMHVLISLKFSFVEATTCDTSSICNLQRIKKLLEIGAMATSFIGTIRVWWH